MEEVHLRSKSLLVFALALGLLSVSVPLFAHHGNNGYDSGKKINQRGRHGVDLVQSHCLLKYDVKTTMAKSCAELACGDQAW